MKIGKNKKKKNKQFSEENLGHKTKEKVSGGLEGKFKNIFENTNDGVVFLDKFGKILEINKKTAEIFGGTKKELVGKNFTKTGLFSVKELPALIRNFTNALTGKTAYLKVSFKNKKGRQVFLECSTSFLKISGSIMIMSLMRDVTEREQAESVLQRQAQKLGERVKELNCLYELSKLFQEQGDSPEKLFQGTVDLISQGWQYPEVTCARVTFEGREFRTENFKETAWRQTSDIIVTGKRGRHDRGLLPAGEAGGR